MILQACLDAGHPLPHYCYHPGLSIPASCRICLVEVEGIPKLVPCCQTPVRDGMVVHSKSHQGHRQPEAGHGVPADQPPARLPRLRPGRRVPASRTTPTSTAEAESRFEEDKAKKPKKDVGLNVLLYNDRCIMCTRCVRFTREVSGTGELYVDGRGHKEEIDIFPGKPLRQQALGQRRRPLPGRCAARQGFPLQAARLAAQAQSPSISPVDAGGENICLEHNEGVIYRIKPRYNAEVNTWWISDDTRYCYKAVHDAEPLDARRRKLQYRHAGRDELSRRRIEHADAELKRAVQGKRRRQRCTRCSRR